MDLHALRYFVAVAEAGSVTRAAHRVHVAQPSLSRQLRRLEAEVGLALFTRTPRGLTPTAAGRRLLEAARGLLTRADQVELTAMALGTGQVERLDLAATAVAIDDIIAPYLTTLGPTHPFLAVVDETPTRLPTALSRGADLVITAIAPVADAHVTLIAQVPIYAYVPAAHPWALQSRVSLPELVEADLLLPSAEQATRQLLDAAVHRQGLHYRHVTECRLPQVAQALAASGRGAAVVSDDPRFALRPLRVDEPGGALRLPLYAAWERGHYADGVIRDLVERLAQYCVDRYGPSVGPGPVSGAASSER
ncbi:MAG TPA: LysR family transcriptional regulator [Verrucomicrobiae bacterium]|nr:LysR family transcriptional regulator [Verrucomicrobiae bacterium]